MKKIIASGFFIFGVIYFLHAQNDPKNKAKTVQKNPNTTILKNLEDSANYAIGMSIANFYKQQGFTTINTALVTRAITETLSGKKLLLDDAQANNAVMNYMNKMQALKAKPNIEAGEKFLATNKNKPGVITTTSGLQYEVVTQGTGPKPTISDTVICQYKGTFLNGNTFDETYSRGQPAEFSLNRVIKGWTEALQLMPVGSKYKLYVPYQLGYGAYDYMAIPGGSLLIFELELVGLKGKK